MASERLRTGIPGLDVVTNGGLVEGGIYLVIGRPGAGKSIFGNQVAYAHARRGGRAVYATLLAETHARLLTQVRQFDFFDEAAVGTSIVYLNALTPLDTDGLEGLLKTLQHMVREQKADLLVLDGLLPPQQLGIEDVVYKRFVAGLQAWVGVIGCTALMLKTGSAEGTASAEQTMVDGIVELSSEMGGMRLLRRMAVSKLRGTDYLEGKHAYAIGAGGIEVYPRIDAALAPDPGQHQPLDERVTTGTSGLDALVGGGFVRGSSTLILGPTGAGKTTACLQFALEGARAGEPTLFFGFYEAPHVIRHLARRLGHSVEDYEKRGSFTMLWRNPAEPQLDREAHALVEGVRDRGIKRVAFDGLAALRRADEVNRISQMFAAVADTFSRAGVTMVVTDEARELLPREMSVPTDNVSALFHNIVFIRPMARAAHIARAIGIFKTRNSAHDQRLHDLEIDESGLRIGSPLAPDLRGLMRADVDADA